MLKKTVMSSSIFSSASSNITSAIKSPKITFGGVAKAIGSEPDFPELDKLKVPEPSPLAGMISELQSKYETLSGVVGDNARKITVIKNILQNERSTIGDKIPGDSNVEDSLNEVNNTLQEIGNALSLDFANRIQEKEDKIALARRSILRQRKRDKEEGIEEGSDKLSKKNSFLHKAFDKVTKPAMGLFSRIISFFTTLGAAILAKGAFDWLKNPGNLEKVTGIFKWLGDNWAWIAGALAIGAVAIAVGTLVSATAGIVIAIKAIGAVLAAIAPVAWPVLAIAAVGLGAWFGWKWLKKRISGGGDFETFDKKLREKTEASGLDFKNAGTGALVLGDDGKSITVPWFGKDGISGKEWKPGDGNKNARDDLNIKNEAHRAYIERTMGKEKLAQLDKAYETYVTLMGQKDILKKKMESEIHKSRKEFYNSARIEEDKLRAEGKISGLNTKQGRLTGGWGASSAGKFWAKKDEEWKNIDEEIRAKYDLILAEEFADVLNFSTGGTVTGPDGIDNISVKLTAGEEVITKASASLFRPLLKDINNNAGEMWLSLERGIKQQTVNNEEHGKINAEFNKILVGFNQQLTEISSKQTGGSVSVSSRPPVTPQIGGSSVSAVPKQVGMLQKSSSVSVVHLDMPDQTMNIDARSKKSEAPQTIDVQPSAVTLGDTIVPSPMDSYNMRRLDESLAVYGIRG